MTIECAKQKGIGIKGIIINSMPEEKTLSQENFIKELKAPNEKSPKFNIGSKRHFGLNSKT